MRAVPIQTAARRCATSPQTPPGASNAADTRRSRCRRTSCTVQDIKPLFSMPSLPRHSPRSSASSAAAVSILELHCKIILIQIIQNVNAVHTRQVGVFQKIPLMSERSDPLIRVCRRAAYATGNPENGVRRHKYAEYYRGSKIQNQSHKSRLNFPMCLCCRRYRRP